MSYSKKRTDFQVAIAKWLTKRKLSTQMRIGRMLGRLFYYLPNKRKTIARINIGLCFPQHTKQQASTHLQYTSQLVLTCNISRANVQKILSMDSIHITVYMIIRACFSS